ncbi:MAG: GNAT family N-acetyltransferase [Syntrophaceae bacterium]|nr:GNAT family N-acetyltransferase [Syntrophaceae bacterium]
MIREAGAADLPRVLPLFGQLGMDDGRVLDGTAAHQLFLKMRSYPDYRLYAAVRDGQVLGAFTLLTMDNFAHLGAPSGVVEDVVVLHGWRGRGIGAAMMRFAMALCREKGCYKMVLSSNRNRKDAHRFYRSLGFREHGYSFEVDMT